MKEEQTNGEKTTTTTTTGDGDDSQSLCDAKIKVFGVYSAAATATAGDNTYRTSYNSIFGFRCHCWFWPENYFPI